MSNIIDLPQERTAAGNDLSDHRDNPEVLAREKQRILGAHAEAQKQPERDELMEGVEPWPNPVKGHEILNRLFEEYRKFVILPDEAHAALALWTLGTYCFDSFLIFPKLLISSPEKRCGKTTALEVLDSLCHRPMISSNLSAAVVFRAVDAWKPALLIDEADTFINANDELRGIINCGHRKQSAYVMRVEGEGNNRAPKRFSTWSPMAIAMIKNPPDTIRDRSILVTLRRKLPNEKTTRMPFYYKEECADLRRMCKRWAMDFDSRLKSHNPNVPILSNDRAEDNWLPMFAIAELAGADWVDRAKLAVQKIEQVDADDESIGPMILADIRAVFTDKQAQKLYTNELVNLLIDLDERPWCEWRHGKPLTARSLAKLIAPYGIKSGTIRIGTHTQKGYSIDDFKDAFARYLSTPLV